MSDDRKRIACLPANWALELTGRSSREINQAVELFARILENSQCAAAQKFNFGEWQTMADASVGYTTSTETKSPGQELAGIIVDKTKDYDYDIRYKINVARLTSRLMNLPEHEAWAVVYTLKFYWRNVALLKNAEPPVPWWLPSFQNQWRIAQSHGLDPLKAWREGF